MSPTRRLLVPVLVLTLLAAACGSSKSSKSGSGGNGGEKVTLRLGYFPNVTHAPAIVGLLDGEFASALGPNVTVKPSIFNAGPAAVEALFSKSIDASFVGPNPAINSYSKSNGTATRIVAGTASGGAFLVVKPEINTAADLKGKKVGSPQLGNTQDVALRYWLQQQDLKTDTNGGGDVHITPADNSTTVQAFQQGDIAGAWVPEPYATKLVKEGGHVLVDEGTLWPGGKYVTTLLVVRTEFLESHPDVVKNLIKGLAASIDLISTDPAKAAGLVSKGVEQATTKPLEVDLVTTAFKSITFTLDPVASSLRADVDHAVAVGTLDKKPDLRNIFDLTLVNEFLVTEGKAKVAS
jgi:NitT/TauT family transport system substrate-binding protein